MELLVASTLRSVHGFPTRQGGVSEGAYASLNCSFSVGDNAENVSRNLAMLGEAAGGRVLTVHQVHGERLVNATEAGNATEADALWTADAGTVVGVRTADCLPVLLEDRTTGAVAAVHAGWRGVIAHIARHAVAQLQAQGGNLKTIYAAIGPGIQKCCFEVGAELSNRFEREFGASVRHGEGAKARLDLTYAVQLSLVQSGVPKENIESLPHCTFCDRRFFSHRRDKGVTGRHLSFIRCGRGSQTASHL